MSILDLLLGGLANSGGSLTDIAKQQGKTGSLGILGMLGNQGGGMTPDFVPKSQINPAFGALSQMGDRTSSWLDNNSDALGKFGDMASRYGAGVSSASDFSREPISFGRAMAGGQQSLDAGKKSDLENQLMQAKIGAEGQMDLEKTAQTALVKTNMGQPLSPQEQAALQAYNSLETSKLQTITLPDGSIKQVPSRTSILPQGMQGGQGMPAQMGGTTPTQGQSPRPNLQDPGFQQFLKAKGLL